MADTYHTHTRATDVNNAPIQRPILRVLKCMGGLIGHAPYDFWVAFYGKLYGDAPDVYTDTYHDDGTMA